VVYSAGFRVELVDPCGAGDAFTAGFIHLLLRGRSLTECCELGNALGAMVAAQSDATVPLARSALQGFCEQKRERITEPDLNQYAPL
jgi:fructokinase